MCLYLECSRGSDGKDFTTYSNNITVSKQGIIHTCEACSLGLCRAQHIEALALRVGTAYRGPEQALGYLLLNALSEGIYCVMP
jgi:hypothetical protein